MRDKNKDFFSEKVNEKIEEIVKKSIRDILVYLKDGKLNLSINDWPWGMTPPQTIRNDLVANLFQFICRVIEKDFENRIDRKLERRISELLKDINSEEFIDKVVNRINTKQLLHS